MSQVLASSGLSKPIEQYPLAKPEDLPAPPPPGAPGEPKAGEPKGAKAPSEAEVAVLEFLDPAPLRRALTLAHPFRFEDREVRVVEVRALSVFEVGRVASSLDAGSDLYPYFAAMTGLPPAVLRAMPSDDGGRLLELCDPFLPRFLTAES